MLDNIVFRYMVMVVLVGVFEPFFTASYRSFGFEWLVRDPFIGVLVTATGLFLFRLVLVKYVDHFTDHSHPHP